MQKPKKYDLVVYIGRFQPFHIAHKKIIDHANSLAEKVLVIVGSSKTSRSVKNPFTFKERVNFIRKSTHVLNLQIRGVPDFPYDDASWIQAVEQIVTSEVREKSRIAIIGMDKDESSYYLKFFPQWELIPFEKVPLDGTSIGATDIRQMIFSGLSIYTQSVLPFPVFDWITQEFVYTDRYVALKDEFDALVEYKKSWSSSPYPPTFVTVDAVVVQSGHILLVQRDGQPGKGLWAMPGGFIGENEKLIDAMIRELREETGLKVPEKVLRGSITRRDVFDDPSRSQRGRTITHAFKIELDDSQELPRLKAGSDAKRACWFSLGDLARMQEELYEDHYGIIYHML